MSSATSAPPAEAASAAGTEPATPAPARSPAPATSPQQVAAVPAPAPPAPIPLDSHALAAQGLEKELRGDHEGALRDLRAALVIEPDSERQQGIRNLIQLLDTRR
jgi:hypothetical protein